MLKRNPYAGSERALFFLSGIKCPKIGGCLVLVESQICFVPSCDAALASLALSVWQPRGREGRAWKGAARGILQRSSAAVAGCCGKVRFLADLPVPCLQSQPQPCPAGTKVPRWGEDAGRQPRRWVIAATGKSLLRD